jgi:hypothetical protein
MVVGKCFAWETYRVSNVIRTYKPTLIFGKEANETGYELSGKDLKNGSAGSQT